MTDNMSENELVPLRGENELEPCHKTRFWYPLWAAPFKISNDHPSHFCMGIHQHVDADLRQLHNAFSDEALFVFNLDTVQCPAAI